MILLLSFHRPAGLSRQAVKFSSGVFVMTTAGKVKEPDDGPEEVRGWLALAL